jgi:hypothetical protein
MRTPTAWLASTQSTEIPDAGMGPVGSPEEESAVLRLVPEEPELVPVLGSPEVSELSLVPVALAVGPGSSASEAGHPSPTRATNPHQPACFMRTG